MQGLVNFKDLISKSFPAASVSSEKVQMANKAVDTIFNLLINNPLEQIDPQKILAASSFKGPEAENIVGGVWNIVSSFITGVSQKLGEDKKQQLIDALIAQNAGDKIKEKDAISLVERNTNNYKNTASKLIFGALKTLFPSLQITTTSLLQTEQVKKMLPNESGLKYVNALQDYINTINNIEEDAKTLLLTNKDSFKEVYFDLQNRLKEAATKFNFEINSLLKKDLGGAKSKQLSQPDQDEQSEQPKQQAPSTKQPSNTISKKKTANF